MKLENKSSDKEIQKSKCLVKKAFATIEQKYRYKTKIYTNSVASQNIKTAIEQH